MPCGCPVVALQQYMCLTKSKFGPLFQYRNGRFLTRHDFTTEVRNLLEKGGIKPSDYAGHSFRIGAATTAAAKKIPVWLIKSMGRWASNCYEMYVQTPAKHLLRHQPNCLLLNFLPSGQLVFRPFQNSYFEHTRFTITLLHGSRHG